MTFRKMLLTFSILSVCGCTPGLDDRPIDIYDATDSKSGEDVGVEELARKDATQLDMTELSSIVKPIEPSVLMNLSDTRTLWFRLTNSEGQPVVSAEIAFALEGGVNGASFVNDTAKTDGNGYAAACLRSDGVAKFSVRATTNDEATASTDVIVWGTTPIPTSWEPAA